MQPPRACGSHVVIETWRFKMPPATAETGTGVPGSMTGGPRVKGAVAKEEIGMTEAGTHIVRVALQGEPTIYREIEVESRKTLSDLAEAIVHAFGFEFDHAFGFYSKLKGQDVMRSQPKYELFADMGERTEAKSVEKTRVADAFPDVGHKMLFMFDYGDDWRFIVEVIGLGQKAAKTRYPKVLKKVGKAPEQYGPWEDDDEDDET
jgi:Plasmid pRiA4b ORF-3-like protein